MVQIDDNTNEDLDQLAMDHYNDLIEPMTAAGGYHSTSSLIGRIQSQRNIDLADPIRVSFWDYFLDNNFTNLQRVIVSRPAELQTIIEEISNQFGNGFLSTNIDYTNATLTDFGRIVKNVFNYGNYRNGSKPAEYFNTYNICYCTYCNKDEVQNIEEINGATGDTLTRRLYQLDHFYPQSRFPYLSLSFFNLIPGCANCNATLKGEKDFNVTTHFNPFNKRFNDYFNFTVESIVPKNVSDISISIENISPHPDSTIEDFKILERYNQGVAKEILFEMIKSFSLRSPKVQRSIVNQLKGLFGSLEHSKVALLKSQHVPLDPKHINSKQFGKLKRDICKQMEVL